jgi:hypothetical protein
MAGITRRRHVTKLAGGDRIDGGVDEHGQAAPSRSSACSTCSWKSTITSTQGSAAASSRAAISGPMPSSPRLALPSANTTTGATGAGPDARGVHAL